MSMAYIRKTYNVPAKRGNSVRYEGMLVGVIVGSQGEYLRVRFGELGTLTLHPTWRVEYLPATRRTKEYDMRPIAANIAPLGALGNAEAHGRAVARTVQPLVGVSE